MKHLHRTDDVYRFIVEHLERTGFSPTIREIKEGTGISSTDNVSYHLAKLVAAGRIERGQNGEARSIRVLDRIVSGSVIEFVRLAEKIVQNAEPSRECLGDMTVDGALILQLQRWTERVGA